MNIKLLLFILLFCSITRIKAEYHYETIEELVPKEFFFNQFQYSSFKIFKYKPACNGNTNSETKNIYIQIYDDQNYVQNFFLFYYDNYSSIKQDKNGNFIDYISKIDIGINKVKNIRFQI